jgi:hypothetical protein
MLATLSAIVNVMKTVLLGEPNMSRHASFAANRANRFIISLHDDTLARRFAFGRVRNKEP